MTANLINCEPLTFNCIVKKKKRFWSDEPSILFLFVVCRVRVSIVIVAHTNLIYEVVKID